MGGYCRIGFRRSIQTSASKNHIAGSAPNYRGHLILETQSYSRDWPSRVESVYSLLPALQSQAQNSASPLHGFGFAISPALDIASDPGKLAQSHREDIQSATLALAGASQVYESEQEIDFTGPLEDVVSRLQDWAVAAQQPVSPSSSRIHLYVCTHAARDCRCGTIGTSFYKRVSILPGKRLM